MAIAPSRRRFLIIRRAIVFALLMTAIAAGQSGGVIRGVVTDAASGEPLPGANIIVSGTVLGTTSGVSGEYALRNLPAGDWQVEVLYIGYAKMTRTISLSGGSTERVDFALSETAIPFDRIVTTGSRQAENLEMAANSVNALDREEIFPRSHNLMAEGIQEIVGVDKIGENVSIRGGSGYSFFSVGGSRVLMLVDDVPMLTSDLGRANWDFIPMTEIERIEVLKGAGSVMYGSGAVGGVVNLITRQPTDKARFTYRLNSGFYSQPPVEEFQWTDSSRYYYGGDISYSQSYGPLGMRLSVSRYVTTGYQQNSQLNRWYFTARPTLDLPDGSNLNVFFAYNKENRDLFFLWDGVNNPLATPYTDEVNVDGWLTSAVYNKVFSPSLMLKARYSINSQLLGLPLSLTKGFDPAVGMSGEVRSVWLPHRSHRLSMGVDWRRDEASSGFFGKHTSNSYSPYVLNTWQVRSNFHLDFGFHLDFYQMDELPSETQFLPRAGFSYEPVGGTILHGSAGRGFRAATAAERFTETDLQGAAELIANPDLVSEISHHYDFGVRQRIGQNYSLETTAFLSNYRNLIEFTQVGEISLILQFRNCAPARIYGVESEAKLHFLQRRLRLLANVTWLHSELLEDDESCGAEAGDPLSYRPEYSARVQPSVHLGPVTIEGEYRYISRFDRLVIFLNEPRVAQKVIDLRLRYRWRNLMVMAQVENANNHLHTIVEQNIGELRNFSLSIMGEF